MLLIELVVCTLLCCLIVTECRERVLQDCSKTAERVTGKPPKEIPTGMIDAFTRYGEIPVEYGVLYIDDSFKGKGSHYGYSQSSITQHGQQCKTLEPIVTHRLEYLANQGKIRGAAVGVVGSQKPIFEGLLLALGASHVTTVEYNRLTLSDSRITTVQGNRFPPGTQLDLAIVADALQHDGLGRYGDPICADADLAMMDSLRAVTKELLVSIPTAEKDAIIWNAHRLYGPIRTPLLFEGWAVAWHAPWDSGALKRTVFHLIRNDEHEMKATCE